MVRSGEINSIASVTCVMLAQDALNEEGHHAQP